MMELLIPSWADLAGWAGVVLASLSFMGLGRLLTLGRTAPEVGLVAGWGAACLVLTLWGVAMSTSLWVPAAAVTALGLLGVAALPPPWRAWSGILRMAVVALPLLAIMASARPSLPDTFLNLMPNAAYLYDHAGFPADDRWPAYSFLPGAPYNMQLGAFIASLLVPQFPPNAMIALNIVLQLAFALFLARVVERSEEDPAAAPSWGAAALGFLLTTALNPGFVPRYHLSAYSETSVTVVTAFAGWFAALALERLTAGRPARSDLTLLALTLAALVNIKQDSIAIAVGLVVAAVALALLAGGERRGRAAVALTSAALPAALLYLAWRWYVLTHFAEGELKPLPFDQWQFGNIPLILRSMVKEMAERAYFLIAAVLAAAGLVWRVRSSGLGRAAHVAALFLGVALVYNAFLFVSYIGHFPGRMSVEAHSYFRYNTHLGLLLVLSLVLLARDIAAERRWVLAGAARRAAPAMLVAVALLCPVVFFGYLRFDLEAPQQRVWQLAAMAGSGLGEEKRLALLLPADNGSISAMLEALIRFTPPRHRDVELRIVTELAPDTLDRLAAEGYTQALVSCVPAGFAGLPAGEAALLERAADGWRAARLESYPPPRGHRWSHVLTEASLCL